MWFNLLKTNKNLDRKYIVSNENITIIVLNYNDFESTELFIQTIRNFTSIEHIIIVDNFSSDDSFIQLKALQDSKIDVIKTDRNGGYGYGNNFGVKYANDKYKPSIIIISNPDVIVSDKTINKCIEFLNNNESCAIVAPIMLDSNFNINYKCAWRVPSYYQYLFFSLRIFGKLFNNIFYEEDLKRAKFKELKVGCVAGSFLLIDRRKIKTNEIYDENIFLYCEETVLGIQTEKKNFDTYLLLEENFIHINSISINKTIKNSVFKKKILWQSRLYVLDNYYKNSVFRKVLSRTIYIIAFLEIIIFSILKKIFNG